MKLSLSQLKSLEHCVTQSMARMDPTPEMSAEQLAAQNAAWDEAYATRQAIRKEIQRVEREIQTFGETL